jgi:hypothetical protein
LKYQLEEALQRSRAGQDALPILDFSSPTIEEDMEANYELALTKAENVVLNQLMLTGQYYACYSLNPAPDLRPYRVGAFLWKYFQFDPQGIPHLTDVSVASIDRVPTKDLDIILKQRPPRSHLVLSPVPQGKNLLLPPPKRVQ